MASALDLGWRFLYRMSPRGRLMAFFSAYSWVTKLYLNHCSPNIFESIGFEFFADCSPPLDLSCTTHRGQEANLLRCFHDAVWYPSLQISLLPWSLDWKASTLSKSSVYWSDKNWLQENLYDVIRILQMNADYQNQGILPRTCTSEAVTILRCEERGRGHMHSQKILKINQFRRHWPHSVKTFTHR